MGPAQRRAVQVNSKKRVGCPFKARQSSLGQPTLVYTREVGFFRFLEKFAANLNLEAPDVQSQNTPPRVGCLRGRVVNRADATSSKLEQTIGPPPTTLTTKTRLCCFLIFRSANH